MRILLIQCLKGISNGEIKIEHINNEKYFYYNFKRDALEKEIESSGNVFLVQFKDEKEKNTVKQCCAMAFGEYEYKDLKIDEGSSEKGLLKLKNIKEIKFSECKSQIHETGEYEYIMKIIKQINPEVLSNATHKINEIEVEDNKYDALKQLFDSNESVLKEKEIDDSILKSYEKFETNLHILAQKSRYAERVQNKERRKENRTEYQRDWERIIHAKTFRRLEDKAQIYTLSKGDHFRTRLTHTLEVTQIARGIARELELNEDLVEAIALAHDLGHTPFGHVGERTLNEILKDEGVEGGFKHNFQGVKVVNYLEEKYGEFEGIDLTYQVMEGILKHTKVCNCDKKKNCKKANGLECADNRYDIKKFLRKGNVKKLHPEYSFSTTLEGQVVAVADEIAQRAHDLDDGIASGIINEEKFLEALGKDEIFKDLKAKIDKSLEYINKDNRDYIDTLDIKRARIVSDVITYFIAEIVSESRLRIEKYKNALNDINDLKELIIKEKLIGFDYDDGSKEKNKIERVRKELENISSIKIINSEEVNCFDGKGEYIIRKLYKAYTTNPRQMSKTTLKRITREMSKYTNDIFDISSGDRELVNKEIEIYKKKENVNDLDRLKHKIFVRCVVDLIAGMTDDFANRQFEKLYSPRTY